MSCDYYKIKYVRTQKDLTIVHLILGIFARDIAKQLYFRNTVLNTLRLKAARQFVFSVSARCDLCKQGFTLASHADGVLRASSLVPPGRNERRSNIKNVCVGGLAN